jgi:hypothetical protein
MISPTPGRVVWVYHAGGSSFVLPDDGQPCAGIVARVWHDRMVNLAVFDANGQSFPMTSVILVQEGDTAPEHGVYATWMPYQVGQAKKHAAEDAVKILGSADGVVKADQTGIYK